MNLKKHSLVLKLLVITALTLALVFGAAACGGGGGSEDGGEEGEQAQKGPIVFAEQSFGSFMWHNEVARYIVENGYGIKTDIIPGESITAMTGLKKGELDVVIEVWVDNYEKAWNEALEAGAVDLGILFPDSVQGWFVPEYVVKGDPERGIEPMAPGLESVEDLPEYWEVFKDPEQPDKGRFHNCIPGWGCEQVNKQKFEAYGLNEYYTLFQPGTPAALASSLVTSYEEGEPWLGYYWGPTWIFGKLDLYQIKEPEYDPEVWKENKGCAWPSVNVNKGVRKGFPEEYPEVTKFLRNMETHMELISENLAYMRDNDAEAREAAIWFLKNKEDVWTEWVSEEAAQNVKESLKNE